MRTRLRWRDVLLVLRTDSWHRHSWRTMAPLIYAPRLSRASLDKTNAHSLLSPLTRCHAYVRRDHHDRRGSRCCSPAGAHSSTASALTDCRGPEPCPILSTETCGAACNGKSIMRRIPGSPSPSRHRFPLCPDGVQYVCPIGRPVSPVTTRMEALGGPSAA